MAQRHQPETTTAAKTIADLGTEYIAEPAETCDGIYECFVSAVLAAIREMCPMVECDEIGCSMGSRYFSVALPGRVSIEIRISNHKVGCNGQTVPEWSFEMHHSDKLHSLGIRTVAAALEISEAID